MRKLPWLVGLLWSAFVLLLAAGTYVGFNPPEGQEPITVFDALWAGAFLGFPTAGALIASKLPHRPLGWILLTSPLFVMAGVFLGDGPVDFAAREARPYYAVAGQVLVTIGMILLLFVPQLVPDGRFLSRAWRRVAWCFVGGGALLVISKSVRPGPLQDYPEFVNPWGVDALKPLTDGVANVEGLLFMALLSVGIASVFIRFRRARGRERAQLKWLAVGLGIVGVSIGLGALSLMEVFSGLPQPIITLFFIAAIVALPTTMAIAILKHRLYDVDVLINRALVYGALTVVLLGLYLGGILAFRNLLPLPSDSDLGVAASTLIVAALFQPLRTRLQRFIDKRFYRRKYDSITVLAAFSTRLRDEVELERIRRDVLGVVGETVQPAHASVWMRGTA